MQKLLSNGPESVNNSVHKRDWQSWSREFNFRLVSRCLLRRPGHRLEVLSDLGGRTGRLQTD